MLLVQVGSKNGLERDFTIGLKYIEGLMKDWLTRSLDITKSKPLLSYISGYANTMHESTDDVILVHTVEPSPKVSRK